MTPQNTLIEKILANQMTFSLVDSSRIVAGDRWVIRLHCSFSIMISDALWATLDNFPNKDSIREMMGKELTHEQLHERHFIDDTEKDDIIKSIIQQIKNDILPYVESPRFVEALFEKRVKETSLQLLTGEPSPPDVEEDDGPADFSHLFT